MHSNASVVHYEGIQLKRRGVQPPVAMSQVKRSDWTMNQCTCSHSQTQPIFICFYDPVIAQAFCDSILVCRIANRCMASKHHEGIEG